MVLVFIEKVIGKVSVLLALAGKVGIEDVVFVVNLLKRSLSLCVFHRLNLVRLQVYVHTHVAKVLKITLDIRSESDFRILSLHALPTQQVHVVLKVLTVVLGSISDFVFQVR